MCTRSWNRLHFLMFKTLQNNFESDPFLRGWGETFTQVRRFPTFRVFLPVSFSVQLDRHFTLETALFLADHPWETTQRDNSLRFQMSFPLRSQLLLIALRLRSLHNNFYLCGKTYRYEKQHVFSVLKRVSTHNSYLCWVFIIVMATYSDRVFAS